MKRFFCVFSIILILFLFVTAGTIAAVQYGSIKAEGAPSFAGGWGVTLMPYYGETIVYPSGDVFLIKRVSAQDVKPGKVILFSGEGGLIGAGYVDAANENGLSVVGADGVQSDISAGNIVGMYIKRVPRLGEILGILESLPAIAVFVILLVVSLLLWRVLPDNRVASGALSKSDGEISSNLY